ncbi:hypothetical protein [Dactylosporangium sp. CA-139066]|uniref:hypothetical protein n=1 Tax=Dactylosporangium sp. CA-139066 TaxID=3239930 RepID=UPI003D91A46A
MADDHDGVSPWARPVYQPPRRPDDPFYAPSPWADPPAAAAPAEVWEAPAPPPPAPAAPPAPPEPEAPPVWDALDAAPAWDTPAPPVSAPPLPAPPMPGPPPARPPASRNSVLIGLLGAAFVAVALGIAGIVVAVGGGPDGDAADAAVEALTGANGVHSRVTFSSPGGASVDADLTFTADGIGSGTITDPGGGTAEVRNNGLHTYVRGDADWWSRRSPETASALAGRWVEPRPGVAVPVNIALSLTPKALGAAAGNAMSGHDPKAAGTAVWRGQVVDVLQYGDWTLALTKSAPRSLVWLGGPLGAVGRLEPEGRLPSGARVAIALDAPDDATLAQTRAAVADVLTPAAAGLSGSGAAPGPAASPAPAELVSQFKVVNVPAPRFAIRVNAPACATPQCQWSVTVTNVGSANGDATVLAGVAPGTPVRTVHLGALQPGAWSSTPVMTFANPGTVRYSVQVYSPALDGPDPAVRQRLQALGVDPSQSPVINELDPALQRQILLAADAMTRGRGTLGADEPSRVVGALEWLVSDHLLPELQTLVTSGRLDDPEHIAARLGQPSARRAVEFAAALLRADPAVHVRIGAAGAAVQDVTNQRAYRLLPDRAQVPDGFTAVAVLFVEPTGPEYDLDRAGLEAFYGAPERHHRLDDALCPGGTAAGAELLVVNGAGRERWKRDQFHGLAAACP